VCKRRSSYQLYQPRECVLLLRSSSVVQDPIKLIRRDKTTKPGCCLLSTIVPSNLCKSLGHILLNDIMTERLQAQIEIERLCESSSGIVESSSSANDTSFMGRYVSKSFLALKSYILEECTSNKDELRRARLKTVKVLFEMHTIKRYFPMA